MTELKTKVNNASVEKFIDSIKDEATRKDSYAILTIMKRVTRAAPKMWGSSIIGFGSYHYVYASGREGDWFLVGFSPRKQNLTVYIMGGMKKVEKLLHKLGKYKASKGSCLYFKRLDDIDIRVLESVIATSVGALKKRKT